MSANASVDEWIAREGIPFSFDRNFDTAVDRMMRCLGEQVQLLGIGEALHGGEEFFVLRNRLFQRLVQAHGFSAITLETNDTRARLVDAYISGRGPATYDDIEEKGFSYGCGRYAGNRELVEWMKSYNSDPKHAVKLSFYGTLPSQQGAPTESPRQALESVLAYLKAIDAATAARHWQIMEPLLGADAEWEDPAAVIEKEIMVRLMSGADAQSQHPVAATDAEPPLALSPRAQALRLAVENLAFELHVRRPELASKSDRESFNAALHNLCVARNLLELHAALARGESLDTLVSMRDAMAAEHLVRICDREGKRGRVLVHLHNAHLRRTRTKLPWYEFWPTGSHLEQLFGARFGLIGGALGTSEANSIGAPEAGTLEARLLAQQTDCFIPARRGKGLFEGAVPLTRSGSTHPFVPYTPLSPQSVADFDMIAFLRSSTYTRGAPPLPG